ncbi:hypothetical protein MUP79_09930 [Candidatus Bathyarchaeota archaeon]|nr:hypothetical protein [Candidatus Bathyarchaeota archaeon]
MELMKRDFGVSVEVRQNPEVAAVGVADLVIARGNLKRLALLVSNLSLNTLYLRPGQTAAATAGIVLLPSGGQAYLFYPEDLTLPSMEWHAIASGAASAILVLSVEMV